MDNIRLYKFLSAFYDLFDLIFLFGRKGNPRTGLLHAIGNNSQRILDICVGTAASSILIASHKAQCEIVGIDVSNDMLAVARRKIARMKLTNLVVQPMSAEALQFPDGSFDLAMVSYALHEFEKDLREKVLQEASRVLKSGGRFCILDFAQQNDPLNHAFIKLWGMIEPPSFGDFLRLDWRTHVTAYGMRLEKVEEFSFSNLYILCKT